MRSAAGRDGRALVRDGRDVDEPVDPLQQGLARLLRARAARRSEEEPGAAAGDPDAEHEGREGRPRRQRLARGDPRDGEDLGARLRPRRRDRDDAVRLRAGALQGARAHPGRHQVRARAPQGRRDRRHRRDAHPRLVALLVRRIVRGALRRGRGARELRQGVRAEVARGAGLRRRRARPDDPRRREGRGVGALPGGARDDHRQAVRAEPRGAARAHATEPRDRVISSSRRRVWSARKS